MSIYQCIDRIEQLVAPESLPPVRPLSDDLRNLIGYIPGLASFRVPEITNVKLNEEQKNWLRTIRDILERVDQKRLSVTTDSEQYEDALQNAINKVNQYKLEHTSSPKPMEDLLTFLQDDLTAVKNGLQPTPKMVPDTKFESQLRDEYKKLQTSHFLVKPIIQGEMRELGLSLGECYGITYSMADSTLSPYIHKERDFNFNRSIHNYQLNQSDRAKDQQTIKSERLTRVHFCPSIKEQAENLYEIAKTHPGQDLAVSLKGNMGAHATYLSMQSNGQIRYMDPNHGAFLFNTKDEFISAYRLMYQLHSHILSKDYTFYAVSKLVEDRELNKTESLTSQGKIRSLITGSKYSDNKQNNTNLVRGINTLGGTALGAVVGAAIGSVIPIVGTVIGGVVGGTLGGMLAYKATQTTQSKGYNGLIGNWHYLRDQWNHFSEWAKGKASIRRERDEIPHLIIEPSEARIPDDKLQGDSTSCIYRALGSTPKSSPTLQIQDDNEEVLTEPLIPPAQQPQEEDVDDRRLGLGP